MANSSDVYTADAINQLTGLLSGAIEAQAMRPQKTSVFSNTTSTPYALQDLIKNRDRIGLATKELDDALKSRETLDYTLASALANVPQQQGYGSWLSDLARGFGSGATMRTNAHVDRAQQKYENQMKDLAEILAFDKAMGETQRQTQTIGYTPMEYSTGNKQTQQTTAQQVPITNKPDWEYWIKNWDTDRPTEQSYRGSEWGRQFSNWRVRRGGGNATENQARQDFQAFMDKNYLPMARSTLKGTGPITDFEDKKYTRWLSEVRDPVQLKDLTVRIIMDVGNKNGWTDEQKHLAMDKMGVLSEEKDLLSSQIEQNPLRLVNWKPGQRRKFIRKIEE